VSVLITLILHLVLIDHFSSVLAGPKALPGFWVFMYRVSPFTYLVSGMLSTGLANSKVSCYSEELLHFSPPAFETCSTYLAPYIKSHGGYLTTDTLNSTTECAFCTISDTNVFLKNASSDYADRWRNLGIFLVYVVFNIVAAVGFYWLARVPKAKKAGKKA
jgi:ATP-binding cassette, subfamily G (WHITE), member 2, PDR